MGFFSQLSEQYPLGVTIALATLILVVTWAIEHVVYKAVRHLGRKENTVVPASSIFANIARVCIWVAGVAVLFKVCFNYDVTGLVAALGIGGIALSLGMQDTLSNLIGGLQVSLGRIVEPGEYIQVLNQEGRVVDVSWRHTTIVDAAGSLHLVPNSLINKNSLVDVGESRDARACFLLPMGTDIDAFTREAKVCVERAFKDKLGANGVRICFVGEELGGVKGNAVADVLRSAYGPEGASDAIFRAIYPVLKRYGAQEHGE